VPAIEDAPGGPIDALYRDVVLEHYRRPRNRRPLAQPTASARADNPLCGDQVALDLRLEGQRIAEVSARSRGCSIAVAAGSILTELVAGASPAEARALGRRLAALVSGESPAEPTLDRRLAAFGGVARFPSRRRCALLAWEALEQALASAQTPQEPAPTDAAEPAPGVRVR
jgi:nitrogen fixation NifU-like protein